MSGFVITMPLFFPALPMMGSTAFGTKDHIVVFLKFFSAYNTVAGFFYIRNDNHLKIYIELIYMIKQKYEQINNRKEKT
jgi:hypothetical protein